MSCQSRRLNRFNLCTIRPRQLSCGSMALREKGAVVIGPGPYRNRFFQAFIVLHYCRMLQDLEEGRVTSKFESAEWAKSKLDPKWIPLIDFCWNERQDTEIHISQPALPEIFTDSERLITGSTCASSPKCVATWKI